MGDTPGSVFDVGVLIGLLAAISVLAGVAMRTTVPYPVVLVIGGLALAFIPGVPSPELDPDLVLLLFLPPILYATAFETSLEELRDDARLIAGLAVGLVVVTVFVVAAIAHFVAGLPWELAFVLGAILGPTDPIAANAVINRVGAPQRIVTILESESLVNDAVAITAYTVALAAVSDGFSPAALFETFGLAVVGGTAIGLLTAWAIARARRLVDESEIQLALSLLTPFVAYFPAEEIGASGVLAAVAAGLYAGREHIPGLAAGIRLELGAFWRGLVFLLNAVLFLLVGLQLPQVLDALPPATVPGDLLWQGVVIAVGVIAIRMAWAFARPMAGAALGGEQDAVWSDRRGRVVVGWSSMRGAVSLALALALPLAAESGGLPDVIFLAYTAIVVTLVVPGLSLGPLITRLGLQQGQLRQRQGTEARARTARAALARLDELGEGEQAPGPLIDRMRSFYDVRLQRLDAALDGDDGARATHEDVRRVRRAVIAAEREELAEMRRERTFPADVLGSVGHDLDVEEARLR